MLKNALSISGKAKNVLLVAAASSNASKKAAGRLFIVLSVRANYLITFIIFLGTK